MAIYFTYDPTLMVDLEGNELEGKDLEDQYLLVFYTVVRTGVDPDLPGETVPEKVTMDTSPIIRNERTYTPARLVAEKLGAKVLWDETLRQIVIEK